MKPLLVSDVVSVRRRGLVATVTSYVGVIPDTSIVNVALASPAPTR